MRETSDKRDDGRRLLRNRVDPGAKHVPRRRPAGESFEEIAREWFERFSPKWASGHSSKIIRRLELYIFSWIGDHPIAKMEAPEILACLRRIEAKGNLESVHRPFRSAGVCSGTPSPPGERSVIRPVIFAAHCRRRTKSISHH